MKKVIFISLGSIFIFIGIIGIFLPILPTTIFLIIASYFFMQVSPALNDKLLNNKYLGEYIRNYKEKRGMPLKSKISSIFFLWTSILISSFYLTDSSIIRIVLFIVAIGVTIHIATLKNLQIQKISD